MKVPIILFLSLFVFSGLVSAENIGCDIGIIKDLPFFGEWWCPSPFESFINTYRLDNLICGQTYLFGCGLLVQIAVAILFGIFVSTLTLILSQKFLSKNKLIGAIIFISAFILGFIASAILLVWWHALLILTVITGGIWSYLKK